MRIGEGLFATYRRYAKETELGIRDLHYIDPSPNVRRDAFYA
jgi:hypothetical protein